MLQLSRRLRRSPLRYAAREVGAPVHDMQEVYAAFLNRFSEQPVYDWRDVAEHESLCENCQRLGVDYTELETAHEASAPPADPESKQYQPMPGVALSRAQFRGMYANATDEIRKAILAHGMLARIAKDTGELIPGCQWAIKTGDLPARISEQLTGSPHRWREILPINPSLKLILSGPRTGQLTNWFTGKVINLPASWCGTETIEPPKLPPPVPVSERNTYTVISGDFPIKIAKKFTGDDGRWRELIKANTQKPTDPKTGNFKTLFPGEKLFLPASWPSTPIGVEPPIIPPAKREPPKEPPEPDKPPPVGPPDVLPKTPPSPLMTLKAIAAVQIQLAFFFKLHASEAPLAITPIFGSIADDFAGIWNERTVAAMKAFQIWANKRGRVVGGIARSMTPLPEDGQPDPASIAVLSAQTSADLKRLGLPILPVPPRDLPLPGEPPPPGVVPEKKGNIGPLLVAGALAAAALGGFV